MELTLPASKTDPFGQGFILFIIVVKDGLDLANAGGYV